MKYCESIYRTIRRRTREVMVGNVGVGGDNPIRIQSMTTSSTCDVDATVSQIMRLADSGCEIARVTVQGKKEAQACESIKNKLLQFGYSIPLVADIHFYPPAALSVIDFVDKVRINPGNYADKRASFKVLEYDDSSYAEEIIRIEEKFTPLVQKAKTLKKSMRIGVNHGSLSDRIMNRYGDTPRGMVESAIEFAQVCRKNEYHDFIFSMKASNPQVMILAYRLLVARMYEYGWDYPLHLGVTEAGEGEDGRIKSAIGIGSLLLDGIGDTIRVSLTEDAWHEIDPCKKLIEFYESYLGKGTSTFTESHRNFENITKREVVFPKTISMHQSGTVYLKGKNDDFVDDDFFIKIGCDLEFGRPKLKIDSADGIVLNDLKNNAEIHKKILLLKENGISVFTNNINAVSLVTLDESVQNLKIAKMTEPFRIKIGDKFSHSLAIEVSEKNIYYWDKIKEIDPKVIFFSCRETSLHVVRKFFEWLRQENINIPVILCFSYECSQEDLIIRASAEIGSLLCDGLGEGILIDAPFSLEFLRSLSFGILQGCRMRTVRTEFISCPSCGRTLFDLQEVTKRIKERTAHLPGVKIAIMGCIVNGPGEMADADFGYVGSRPGKIDLYVGKKRVEQDIDFKDADDKLIELIKLHGKWIEPLNILLLGS